MAASNTPPPNHGIQIPNAGIGFTEGGCRSDLIGQAACGRAVKRDDAIFEEIPKDLLRAIAIDV
jgi:hypothetical protein